MSEQSGRKRVRPLKIVVSSEEMRRLSREQEAQRQRDAHIAVHGSPEERRALRRRNSRVSPLPFSLDKDF